MKHVHVLICDDQELVRLGLRTILQTQPGVTVVGEAGDGVTAVAQAAELRPDVVLMDIRMPGLDGVTATEQIKAALPETHVLVLTTFDLDEYAYAALRAGAAGFLLKSTPAEELILALRAVVRGDAVVSPIVVRRLLDRHVTGVPHNPADDRLTQLTDREREVLCLVAAGLPNAEIARRLHLGETTVKTHVSRILTKLDLRDRIHAVVFAYETGLVRPGSP